MTITTNDARDEFTATAGQTVFNYTFKIFEDSDLNVYVTPTGQVANDSTDITTSYTVTGVGAEAGGTIILSVGATVNDLITIVSNIPSSRTTDYQTNGDFIPQTVNDDFDRVLSIVKKIEDTTNRAVVTAQSQQGPKPLSLPLPVPGKILRWNGSSDGLENVSPSDVPLDTVLTQDLTITKTTIAAMTADVDAVAGQFINVEDYATGNNSGVLFFKWVAGAASAPDGGSQIDHDTLAIHAVQNFPVNVTLEMFGGSASDANISPKFQAAIDFTAETGRVLVLGNATYTALDTINIPERGHIQGQKKTQYDDGFGSDPKASRINFNPTSSKVLFNFNGTSHSGFRLHTSIEGVSMFGNANALNALDLNGIIYSRFANLAIDGFTYGITCDATINNRFENILIDNCITACVLYEGNLETTDVWDQVTFFGTTSGVTFAGSSLSIRFVHCLFEQIGRFGLNMVAECQNIMLDHCYAEDVVFDGGSGDSFIRAGASGTPVVTNNLTVIGGTYNGRNAGNAGSFINSNLVSGIQVVGATVSRFEQVITASANTADNSIVVHGVQGISWDNGFYVGPADKIQGTFPQATLGSASYGHTNQVRHSIAEKFLPTANNASDIGTDVLRMGNAYIRTLFVGSNGNTATYSSGANTPEGAITATVGSVFTRTNGGANTTLYVKESGTGNTGWAAI